MDIGRLFERCKNITSKKKCNGRLRVGLLIEAERHRWVVRGETCQMGQTTTQSTGL